MGDRLTQRQAILAKCAECMGNHIDGRIDCQMPECPLYPFMPYGSFKSRTPKKPYIGKVKMPDKHPYIDSINQSPETLPA